LIYQPEPAPSHRSSNLVTLIVVGGLLVAAAIVFSPMFMRPTGGGALRARKLSNAKQMLIAVEMYSTDFDGRLPLDTSTGRAIFAAIQPYVKNEGVLDTLNATSPEWLGNGSLGGRQVSAIKDPFRTLLLFESAPSVPPGTKESRRAVGYVDGQARFVTEATFQEAIRNGLRTP